jgi:hypothetical protein
MPKYRKWSLSPSSFSDYVFVSFRIRAEVLQSSLDPIQCSSMHQLRDHLIRDRVQRVYNSPFT